MLKNHSAQKHKNLVKNCLKLKKKCRVQNFLCLAKTLYLYTFHECREREKSLFK